MTESEIRSRMQKSLDFFRDQVRGLRHGTVTPALIDTVKVSYFGQPTPIKHLAVTEKIPNKGISVVPFDASMVGTVTNALKNAGFNAYTFSKTTVMVSVPPPSGDEKERVRKRIRELAEDAKVAVRNVRKQAKKSDDCPENLQTITDYFVNEIDEIAEFKSEAI